MSYLIRRSFGFACAVVALCASPVLAADEPQLSQAKLQQGRDVIELFTQTHVEGDLAAKCFIWNDVAIAVGPDTTADRLWGIVAEMPEPFADNRYQLGNRWTTTATNPTVSLYTNFTLTYSFAPDGTNAPGTSGGGNIGPSDLFAQMNGIFGTEAVWQARLGGYFQDWGALNGITYVQVTDDGAAFGAFGSNTSGSTRGDCRVYMRPNDGPNNVLAFNFFPTTLSGNGGDMVMDSGDTGNWSDSSQDYRVLRNVFMHEHGHGMGVFHVDPINLTKLMEAFLATNFVGPQEDDIRAAQRQYGDNDEANDVTGTATALGTLASTDAPPYPVTTRNNIAIEDNGVSDIYSFSVGPDRAISATITPVGTTYLQGSQGGPTSNTNALSIHDLQVTLIGTDGTTILSTDNSSAIATPEVFGPFDLPSAGTFFLRVSPANNTNDIQRYTMALSVPWNSTTPVLETTDVTSVDDTNPPGNSNGAADPGESNLELFVEVENVGSITANSPTATLISTTPGITVTTNSATYPTINAGGTATNTTPFVFSVSPSFVCGTPIEFDIEVDGGPVTFTYPVSFLSGEEVIDFVTTNSTNVPVTIPTNTTVTSTITIADPGLVVKAYVRNLNVTHTGVGDLVIKIIAPDLTEVTIFNRHGGNGDNLVNTNFDDAAGPIITGGSAPFTGTFRPVSPLSALIGVPVTGTWTLQIQDADATDAGTLTGWTLALDTTRQECDTAVLSAESWNLHE